MDSKAATRAGLRGPARTPRFAWRASEVANAHALTWVDRFDRPKVFRRDRAHEFAGTATGGTDGYLHGFARFSACLDYGVDGRRIGRQLLVLCADLHGSIDG